MIGISRRMMQGALGAAGAFAVLVGVTTFSQEAAAGISNTRHNLTSNPNGVLGGRNQSNQTDLCVFCHTPHGADVTSADAPPLWNKRLTTGATYRTYADLNSATIDGQFASVRVGSVSLACLSCHDGSQAMDNIINTPGSGTTTGTDGGGTSGAGFTWTGPRVDANGFMTGPANLGIPLAGTQRDLSNDHPIGIQYCGGFTTGTTCRDPDFRTVSTVVVGTTTNYYVDTATFGGAATTTRDKTDMILFNRSFAAGNGLPSVECGTCHDPHTDVGASATQVAFLRVANNNSNLCLTCHNK